MRTTQRGDRSASSAGAATASTAAGPAGHPASTQARHDRRHASDDSDLTARARIRDAALECFATEGFDATVREIAKRAGVSPGLITHHFGSKDALRVECDAEVLRRYRALKESSLEQPTERMLEELGDAGKHGPILLYILRSLQSGGPAGRAFIDHLIDDARDYMTKGVANGMIKPSRDEEARLRYLTNASLGALLIEFSLADREDQKDLTGLMGRRIRDTFLPTLELFTEGLLADSTMLDTYVTYTAEHDDEFWHPAPAPASAPEPDTGGPGNTDPPRT